MKYATDPVTIQENVVGTHGQLLSKIPESKKDETKKVMLLNNLNLSTSYNLAADSLAWSPMRISGGTQFFKQKILLFAFQKTIV